MEYLQYTKIGTRKLRNFFCFKPCYKWNTFNTIRVSPDMLDRYLVLNLVISGIPSIQKLVNSNGKQVAKF